MNILLVNKKHDFNNYILQHDSTVTSLQYETIKYWGNMEQHLYISFTENIIPKNILRIHYM